MIGQYFIFLAAIGGGAKLGAEHSQCPESVIMHAPGLKLVIPSTSYDAKDLLKTAIRNNKPVVYFYHKGLMGLPGVTFLAPYAASKAGVISLTQSMAQYLAPFNVNVNAICPGIIWTPMWEEGIQMLSQDGPDAMLQEIFENIVQSQIAFKRVQYPEDLGRGAGGGLSLRRKVKETPTGRFNQIDFIVISGTRR